MSEYRSPMPPFTLETAIQKVRIAENSWNTCDPAKVSLGYARDNHWRNRSDFLDGRAAIVAFLQRKWVRELEYRLIKELWAFTNNWITVRFAYEWRDDSRNWFRSYGNDNRPRNDAGLMEQRHASISELPIRNDDRKFHWNRNGPRPADHPGLCDRGL